MFKRYKFVALVVTVMSFFTLPAVAAPATVEGMVSVASQSSVQQTADQLVAVLTKKGMTVFNRIDHAKGAKGVGVDLPPTQVIIFGNPKIGSQLMRCSQTTAIDLPQKMLVFEDAEGKIWLSYNSPAYLQDRHHIEGCEQVLAKVTKALAAFAAAAAQ